MHGRDKTTLKVLVLWLIGIVILWQVVQWSNADGPISAIQNLVEPGEVAGSPPPAIDTPPRASTEQSGEGNKIVVHTGDSSPVTITINQGSETKGQTEVQTEEQTEANQEASEQELPHLLDTLAEMITPIMESEEYRENPYEVAGIPHVCYGHQLKQEKAMSARECVNLLANDVEWAINLALDFVGDEHWNAIGVRRQGVFLELAYMLGRNGLMQFERARKATREGNWKMVAIELNDSRLPKQIGQGRMDYLIERLK